MLEWPRYLISARTIAWQLAVPSLNAGATLGGVAQDVFHSGGPIWRLTVSGMVLRGRNGILAGRALQGALGNGERPFLIRPCDCRQTPLEAGGSFGASPDTDGSPFEDFSVTEENPIVATISAASLRAVTATITVTNGAQTLIGGEQFSVDHSIWDRRMYRIIEITSSAGGVYQVKFRPPLRQATTADQSIDFNRPGVVMRLDSPFQLEQTVRGLLHTGAATFCELERPPTEAEA